MSKKDIALILVLVLLCIESGTAIIISSNNAQRIYEIEVSNE